MTTTPSPRAFISWAHRGHSWTDTQAATWQGTVLDLATLLRQSGVISDLDLWHETDHTIDWTRWGPSQVEHADYVVVAINEPWAERWKGANIPSEGAGAVAEADTLKGLFSSNQMDFQRKVRIVVLPGASARDIPRDLERVKRFTVGELTPEGIDSAVRDLLQAPRFQPPNVSGALPHLGASSAAPSHLLDFREDDLLLLRFRNLPHPTILNHSQVIATNPQSYVWWGWWKKFRESPQIDLWEGFGQTIGRSGRGLVALFDSGTGSVRRAWASGVLPPRISGFGDAEAFEPDEVEWHNIPEYYRPRDGAGPGNSFAWLRLTEIEERPGPFHGQYMFISPDVAQHGVRIDHANQLWPQDQSLWHVRRAD